MSFGQSRTSKFLVGTFEVRLGAMENAGGLSSAHSIGVVDNFSLQMDMQKVELTESFPARIVDTALSSSLSSFSANLKEYSARNMRTMLSAGVEPYSLTSSQAVSKGNAPPSGGYKANTLAINFNTVASNTETVTGVKITADNHFVFAKLEATSSATKITYSNTTATNTPFSAFSSYTAPAPTLPFLQYDSTSYPLLNDSAYSALSSSTVGVSQFVGHPPRNYGGTNVDSDSMTLALPTDKVGSLHTFTLPIYVLNGSIDVYIDDNTFTDGSSKKTFSANKTLAYKYLSFYAKDKLTKIRIETNRGDDVFVIAPREAKLESNPVVTITGGDLVTIFVDGDPTNVTVAEVASVATGSITLKAPGLNQAIPPNSTYTVYKNEVVRAGEPDPTKQFFSATLVQLDRNTGAPLVFDFWKCSMTSGLNVALNNANFSSMDMQVKVLKPTARDYASGGPLAHLSQIIPRFPTWRYSAMPD